MRSPPAYAKATAKQAQARQNDLPRTRSRPLFFFNRHPVGIERSEVHANGIQMTTGRGDQASNALLMTTSGSWPRAFTMARKVVMVKLARPFWILWSGLGDLCRSA